MALEKTRNFHKAAILKCAIFIKNVTEDVTNEQISTYYDRCTEAWRLFQEVHIEILHVTGEEFMPYQEAEFDSVEAVALDIIPRYKTHLRAFTNNDEFVDAHSKEGDDVINKTNGGLRVPYFKIPLFAGNYDAWPAFKDLFRAMIHFNEKMSPVQKLGYLKANVSGEALQIIKNLEITDANYYAAWTLLVDRYDNQRFLINRWIHLIVSIPYSKGSAADIKAILDGTQEALQGLKNLLDQEIQFAELLANDGVTWHFSPPSAPHFNGLAEAGVRSMKYHFRRIIGLTLLTYEELNTVLCQIEAVLNSRPISPLTDDFSDFSVLTPGHFLIGSAPLTTPQPSLLSVNENRLSRWQLTEQMKQSFWKIWSLEYLNNLQQRPKWRVSVQNLSVGQLVIIQQDNLPPMKWLLGRIQEIHPGPDELVRVASVRTQNSILTRPIAKLCPLPLQQLPSLGDASEEN